MPSKEKEFIKADKLTLSEWLELISLHEADSDYFIIDYQFPTDNLMKEYIETINNRSDSEVKSLLRKFLIAGGSLGSDESIIALWKAEPERMARAVRKFEFAKRMVSGRKPWEGNTWIIDLIPSNPNEAISALNAYILAHVHWLPDGRFTGMSHALSIIRARYCDYEHPKDYLLDLQPRDFEFLIACLYDSIGYLTSVTKETRDGGYDVLCKKDKSGSKEILLIECKKYTQKIGIKYIREFCGVVESNRVNKGIFITTSSFTSDAIKYAKQNRIELISWEDLYKLLNQYLGQDFKDHIDFYISMKKVALKKMSNGRLYV